MKSNKSLPKRTIHNELIDKIIKKYNFLKSGYNKTLKEFMNEVDDEWIPIRKIIPDAYRYYPNLNCISVIEVEDGHPLDLNKLQVYADTWFELDCVEEFCFNIFGVNKQGIFTYYPLVPIYYRTPMFNRIFEWKNSESKYNFWKDYHFQCSVCIGKFGDFDERLLSGCGCHCDVEFGEEISSGQLSLHKFNNLINA